MGLIPLDPDMHCNTCDLAKSHRIPHTFSRLKSTHVLENIHLDLSGIIRTPSLCGAYYYILFTDDYTRYRYVSFLCSKSAEDVHLKVSQFIALVERQQGRQVKKITLDNGSEFINDTMSPACEKLGIYLRTTAAYTPEENGLAERSNRTIVEKARALLIEANLPIRFWAYAIRAAVYLANRTITSSLPSGKTPFEEWHGYKPFVGHVRTFGCHSNVLIRKALWAGKFS